MAENETSGVTLEKLRKQYTGYSSAKTNEIEEQRLSWRYYHAAQYTDTQLEVLRKRTQPAITFNRIGRKVDGLVGTIRKLRTDPKGYPRTEAQEDGAELATQVIREILDASQFEDIEAECVRDAGVHGYGVSEMTLIEGDQGDPDIGLSWVDPRTFFYDPRSVKADFSDARYMGVSKWADLEEIEEIIPGGSKKVRGADDGSYINSHDTDRENLWTDDKERVRLVDHWYIAKGQWWWCLHVGTVKLAEGKSPFYDHRGRSICKYFAFSNQIDHDGDHYGFVRNMKGPQDAINQHRSKAMHIMNTRQIIARDGAFDDIETIRREAQRPDGVIIYKGQRDDFQIDQPAQEFLQQTQYFQDAKDEIENFGPNVALVGTGAQSRSGRALAMMQQSGLAELGPFLKNYRTWKLAQYRAVWCAAQHYWTAERWIRVTDDEGLAQFIQLNGVDLNEFGQPALVNALGAIDVDIVIDEGPDTETVMGDVNDILASLASNGVPVPPQVFIETSSLPGKQKKKINGLLSQADPVAEQGKKIALEGEAAKVEKTRADTAKISAETVKTEQETMAGIAAMMQPPSPEQQPFQPY